MLKKLGKGLGGSAIQGGAGAAGFYAHRMASVKIAAVQNHPLVAPGALFVLGHLLKKKSKYANLGAALCGIAGYAGAQVFELAKATSNANPPKTTSGLDDDETGALTQATEIGALTAASEIGSLQTNSLDSAADAYRDALEMSNF